MRVQVLIALDSVDWFD